MTDNTVTDTTTMIAGRIGDIFAHRFVVKTDDGRTVLADLGPKGAMAFPLVAGAEIVATGETKPSELKIRTIALKGGMPLTIEHKPKHGDRDRQDDEAIAIVVRAGFEPIGAPRRKPKHVEVLARKETALVECHVDPDGTLRKQKPIDHDDTKWAPEIRTLG
jgi:hypothetical protein